jgi:hypothetical protein
MIWLAVELKYATTTTPIEFTKPTQHKPTTRVNIFHALNLHTCGA